MNGAGAEQSGDQKVPGNRSLWAHFKSVVELKVKPRLQWDGRLDLLLASFCLEREQKRSLSLGLSCPPEEL